MAEAKSSNAPTDRLTRMCDAAIEAFEKHPEWDPGDKCMFFIDSERDKRGGFVIHGYEDHAEAGTNLLFHMKALFESNGMTLEMVPMNKIGQG